MGAMASQITSLTIVYAAVYSGADQRKRDSSASLAFVREIHRWPVNSPHKWPVTRKMFPFDDVIMRLVPLLHCCIVVSQSINQGMFQIGENPVYLKQLPEHITDPYIFRTWFSNILSAIWGSGVCVCVVFVYGCGWVGGDGGGVLPKPLLNPCKFDHKKTQDWCQIVAYIQLSLWKWFCHWAVILSDHKDLEFMTYFVNPNRTAVSTVSQLSAKRIVVVVCLFNHLAYTAVIVNKRLEATNKSETQ